MRQKADRPICTCNFLISQFWWHNEGKMNNLKLTGFLSLVRDKSLNLCWAHTKFEGYGLKDVLKCHHLSNFSPMFAAFLCIFASGLIFFLLPPYSTSNEILV